MIRAAMELLARGPQRRRRSTFGAIGVLACLVTAMLPSSAQAAVSAGLSQKCDAAGHCVTGQAFSVNAASEAGQIPGKAVAVCLGSGNGALIVDITCSIGGESSEISFPGTAGAVPLVVDAATLNRLPVCWSVTGYFINLSGAPIPVNTHNCALVAA